MAEMPHADWLGLLIDHEVTFRDNRRLVRRLAAAKLRQAATIDPVRVRTGLWKRNPSLDEFRSKFRILKNHRAETRREIRVFPCDSSQILGERPGPCPLTLGKGGTSASTRNSRRETPVAG
jgi:hypothetical protein